MTERSRSALDVSRLPTFAFGHRDPLWFAVLTLIAIEGTAFVLLLLTYLYLRGADSHWPPSALSWKGLFDASAGAGVLLVSGFTMHFANVWAKAGEVRKMKIALALTVVAGFAFAALRWLELRAIPFRWDDHAYGSVVWVLLGMHTFHLIFAHAENTVLLALFLFYRPLEKRHLVDVHVNAFYWYFMAIAGLSLFGLLYLDGAIR